MKNVLVFFSVWLTALSSLLATDSAFRTNMQQTIAWQSSGIAAMRVVKNMQQAIAEHKLQGKILLQIHDELLVSCPQGEVEQTIELLRDSLVSVVNWEIPLEVSIRTGKTWRDVTK